MWTFALNISTLAYCFFFKVFKFSPLVCIGQYLEGGTCKCFLSVERALRSVFLFTPVLHVLVIQIFRNLQVVKRQQVEEFVRRLIFPISQAAVAASEQSSSYINYFSKLYFRGFP